MIFVYSELLTTDELGNIFADGVLGTPAPGPPRLGHWGRLRLASKRLEDRHNARLRRAAGDMDLTLAIHEDVDLAANAELR